MNKTDNNLPYGIKAYGHEHRFKTKREFKAYLMDWIAGTDGAERDRAVDALTNLECGVKFTDTDKPEEPLTPEELAELERLYAPKH